MAVGTGFSHPVVALYTYENAQVKHTNKMSLGRGVSVNVDPEVADDNKFYADNVLAEAVAGLFTGGTGTVTVDGLDATAAKMIFGLANTRTVSAGGSSVTVQGYSDAEPPFCTLGYIYRRMMNGTTTYIPTVLTKVKFNIPSKAWNTQEESIDWQTQEISFNIFRDDTTNHEWMFEPTTGMADEADAITFLDAMLSATISA